ncbi:MAG: PilY2 family type 4a fimbrial biogenesis protein [Nitrococcus sp.]|nr:PilY2 family type 4a fimbrial biogenesis protein [Nitrococcus sp.]
MERNPTRRFFLQLLAIGLLCWAQGAAAQGVNTFEDVGVIQELDPIGEQVVIGDRHYILPTAVARQATDQHGAPVMLQPGMLVSVYGTISGRSYQIQGIRVLRWDEQKGTAKRWGEQ